LTVTLNLLAPLTDREILELTERNPGLQIEQGASGELILTHIGGRTNLREVALGSQLYEWAEKDGRGLTFSSSAGFRLPDGSLLSPDASWLRRDRWDSLTREQREGFAPFCPDAVFEILTHHGPFYDLRAKMRSYVANGARLAVLVDAERRAVEIYAPGRETEIVERPLAVSFDPVLPRFTLNPAPIFE
jgi:Uma2 family endonuclease